MGFVWSILVLVFLVAVVVVVIALSSYNKLQRLSQDIMERASNVQIAISKKLTLINQLIDVVKNFQEGEQFTYIKISQDSSAMNLISAYQQSGTLLTTLQGVAERFPNLKASEQYHRLVDSIQGCEAEVQQSRQTYNQAVKSYNTVCLSIPTVFIARLIGFSVAPYLEFDTSGVKEVSSLKEFKTDDGERLQQLLSSAGSQIAGATKVLASKASDAGKMLTAKVKESSAPLYFYMAPGGVPNGPVPIDEIRNLLAQGAIDRNAQCAEAGTQDWKSIKSLLPEFEKPSA